MQSSITLFARVIHRPTQPGCENIKEQCNYYNDSYHYLWAVSRENLTKLYSKIKGADQPTYPRSLISAFVVRPLESLIDKLATRKISAF